MKSGRNFSIFFVYLCFLKHVFWIYDYSFFCRTNRLTRLTNKKPIKSCSRKSMLLIYLNFLKGGHFFYRTSWTSLYINSTGLICLPTISKYWLIDFTLTLYKIYFESAVKEVLIFAEQYHRSQRFVCDWNLIIGPWYKKLIHGT